MTQRNGSRDRSVPGEGGRAAAPGEVATDAPAGESRARRRGPQSTHVSPQGKSRHTFEFYPETASMLERVRRRTCSATANEAVRKALALLDRHLAEVDAGSRAVYVRPNGSKAEIIVT